MLGQKLISPNISLVCGRLSAVKVPPPAWAVLSLVLPGRRVKNLELVEHEGGDVGLLAPRLVATRRARMPGAHERLQQDGALSLRDGSQLCDPLRRLPVRDARVVERAGREQRGIDGRPDVVVGRVRLHV